MPRSGRGWQVRSSLNRPALMASDPIYLDHHATTPVDARVLEAMLPYFSEVFGNPSAITHEHGRRAAKAVEDARVTVAGFFGVDRSEVFFTAGATESNNIVLQSLGRQRGRHVVVSAVEHKSVLEPARLLASEGVEVTILAVDRDGIVSPGSLRESIRDDTSLVSIMTANGEVGSVQPVSELGAICRERRVPFHMDATQAIGKIAVDHSVVHFDLLSLSAHKFYGPKGVGVLIAKRGTRIRPLMVGGGQERGARSGTVNVPAVVGLAAALDLRSEEMAEEAPRLARLRDQLRGLLLDRVPGVLINGPSNDRLPGNLNASFEGVEAESVMMAVRGFSLSSGSACGAGSREPSHVLLAMGRSDAQAMGSIRFGLGSSTTEEQIGLLVEELGAAVVRIRSLGA